MILSFHFICFLAQQIVSDLIKSLYSVNLHYSKDIEHDNSYVENVSEKFSKYFTSKKAMYVDGNLNFYPPMYIQRYNAVANILSELVEKQNIKKVIFLVFYSEEMKDNL